MSRFRPRLESLDGRATPSGLDMGDVPLFPEPGNEFLFPPEGEEQDLTHLWTVSIGQAVATGVQEAIAAAATENIGSIDWAFIIENWNGNVEGDTVLAGHLVDNQGMWTGNLIQGSATNANAGKLHARLSITVADITTWGVPTGTTTIYNVDMHAQAAPGRTLNPSQIAQGWITTLAQHGFSGVNLAAQNGPNAEGLSAVNGFTISLGHKTEGVVDGIVVGMVASTISATDMNGNNIVVAPEFLHANSMPIMRPW